MTNSTHGGLLGAQHPRVCAVPDYVSSAGLEAVELAQMAGLFLDPWQQLVLAESLGERPDGKWAAFEVGLTVSRQNGKGSILEARTLAGLFLLGERFITHSAHQFDTSLEAFRRLKALLENNDEFSRRIKKVSNSHGEEGIELTTGQRVRFRTRTKGGGRGFSGDCLILDEAMILPESAHGALLPTLSARPNPQVWYTGSAVDQDVHEHGIVFARIRERGLKGDDPALAYFEWSPNVEIDGADDVADDRDVWAQANPGLGIRISEEHVARERQSLNGRSFAVERLGIGDWPRLDVLDDDGLSLEAWKACLDEDSKAVDPVCFAFDVKPNRSASAIGAASLRADGMWHIEVIDHRPGTGWVASRLKQLQDDHHPLAIKYDEGSPAAALVNALDELDVDVDGMNAREHAQACGMIFDAAEQHALRHLGTAQLEAAIRGAARRPLGDAWAWSRKSSVVDISPLVACTLALFGAMSADRPSVYESRGLLVI